MGKNIISDSVLTEEAIATITRVIVLLSAVP
jgi:hypothetical protein